MVDDPFAKANAELINKLPLGAEGTPKSSFNYPQKSNRYCRFGWNRDHQACYTDDEKNLLKLIVEKYKSIADSPDDIKHFDLQQIRKWYDTWQCDMPEKNYAAQSFTLENTEIRDPKKFPLWNFANIVAKEVATKQSERVKDQIPELLNDPTMLVLEEIKNWLIDYLANKECEHETLHYIAKRQNYIRNVMHLLPDFGSDRLYLHELGSRLEEAKNVVLDCVANKQLPELLSNIFVKAKSLEATIATYLHFLLINEEVSVNFSEEFIKGTASNCAKSPLCKIYREVGAQNSFKPQEPAHALTQLSNINHFYDVHTISENEKTLHLKLDLKTHVMDKINFATFATLDIKKQYLESIALLDSLKTISDTFAEYKTLQTPMGTHMFAMQFLGETQRLVTNYLALINQTRTKISALINTANLGYKNILSNPNLRNSHKHFVNNLRALETHFSKETTLHMQLENYCMAAKQSVLAYHDAMQKLVADIESGKALHNINNSIKNLLAEINRINMFLPAQLSDNEIKITKTLPSDQVKQLADNSAVCQDVPTVNQEIILFDYGLWDLEPKIDTSTQEKIYVYRVYKNNQIVGTAEFYGQPYLCMSQEKNRHNIIKLTGVLSDIHIPNDLTLEAICEKLPPTMFDKIFYTTIKSSLQGFLRGSSNIFAVSLRTANYSRTATECIRQLTFYGSVFAMNFVRYFWQLNYEDSLIKIAQASVNSALDTANLFLVGGALDLINLVFTSLATYAEKKAHSYTSFGLKHLSSLISFSLFAYGAESKTEAAASFVAGAGTQIATEYVGIKLLSNLK